MKEEILCKKCICAVICADKQFCLREPLFTYTERVKCKDYAQGTPSTEQEWKDYHNGKN